MFCLRSWLPLLFIPTNASPSFIFLFFICTYFLNRPCFYCSVLLLVLFLTSCNWSDRCFFDFSSNWFQPHPLAVYPTTAAPAAGENGTAPRGKCACEGECVDEFAEAVAGVVRTTATALATAAADELARHRAEWTGLGIEWLRSLLGKREWRIECMDVYIRL